MTVRVMQRLSQYRRSRSAKAIVDVCSHRGLAQGLGIDIGAVALFAFLVRRDLAARDKQMARMLREEKLGVLQLELANRKVYT